MKKPGDVIQLGDTVGHPMEPYRRLGRIVGIRKDNCKPIEQVITRMFKKGDGWFPTGELRTSFLVVPLMEPAALTKSTSSWEGWE